MPDPEPGRPGVLVSWHQHARMANDQVHGASVHDALQRTMNAAIGGCLSQLGFEVEPYGESGCWLVTLDEHGRTPRREWGSGRSAGLAHPLGDLLQLPPARAPHSWTSRSSTSISDIIAETPHAGCSSAQPASVSLAPAPDAHPPRCAPG